MLGGSEERRWECNNYNVAERVQGKAKKVEVAITDGSLNDGSPRFKCLGLEHRYTESVISRGLSIILISLADELSSPQATWRQVVGIRGSLFCPVSIPFSHPISLHREIVMEPDGSSGR